eukprot:gene20848-27019_t
MSEDIYDCIVVGLGGHGSAACYHLANKGFKVLGIEQFENLHKQGSSHGFSRVIRQAYYEDPKYVPLMKRSFQLWRDLENYEINNKHSIYPELQINENLLHMTGGLMIGHHSSKVVKGTLESVKQHNLLHEVLSKDEMSIRFPLFKLSSDEIAIYESEAGYLIPEQCISTHCHRATAFGAKLQYNEAMISWSNIDNNIIEVLTSKSTYRTKKLVLTVGAWAQSIYGNELSISLAIEKRILHWFEPTIDSNLFKDLPIFIWDTLDGSNFYGFPKQSDIEGIKISFHSMNEIDKMVARHPNDLDREVKEIEINNIRNAFRYRIPSLDGELLTSSTCMYTVTKDEHFIVDWHPKDSQVLLVSPCSGHGFKFCAVIGEIVSDLITNGHTSHDISLFTISNPSRGIYNNNSDLQ